MNTEAQTGRKLTTAERALITSLVSSVAGSLDEALVVDMRDGGMGSIRFLDGPDCRRFRSLAEAQYSDDDGVLVIIELNVDQNNKLFELAFWKVDFSPLRRYPDPQDLNRMK